MYPTEPAPADQEHPQAAELDRERRWAFFESDCRDFAEAEPDGWSAVLRAVSRAMKDARV